MEIVLSTYRKLARALCRPLILFAIVALPSCAPAPPPVVAKQLPSPVMSQQVAAIDPELLARLTALPAGQAYRVGPGDTLLVAVYGHPELSFFSYTGSSPNLPPSRSGLVVDNDGSIQFPLLGSVAVAGKSTNELRVYLERELAPYVNSPKVTVQVTFAGSLRYYLLGQFNDPGLKFSDRPLRLLEALSLGGSVLMERASLRSAYVARGNTRLPINFYELIREGDLSQNIALASGDVILIPDSASEQAFVFGGVAGSNPGGGPVAFVNGRLSLLQALSSVGFGVRERTSGLLSETRVIRSRGAKGFLYEVNAELILEGKAAPFELEPGDVVFVPNTAIADWNQALEQILPTLQTVSGLLTPFVQIKFLSE